MEMYFSAKTEGTRKSVLQRDQVPAGDKWDLTLLYPTDEAWEQDFEKFKSSYSKVQEFKGKIGQSDKELYNCLKLQQELELRIERLGHYTSLQTSEDGANAQYLRRQARLQQALTLYGEKASFIDPEIQAIDDKKFEEFLTYPPLEPWVLSLKRLRRYRPHTLSEKEERLMALVSASLAGSDEAFSQLTNVDMKFGFIKNENGEEVELSHGAFASFMQKRDQELRKQAFHQYYQEFKDHQYTIASTLAFSIKSDVFYARARNFASAREAALFPDNMPVGVYDNLIATVRGHLPALFRYFELRKKALGIKQIHHYDTYLPLVKSIQKHTTFDEAVETVLASLKPLGDEYVKTLGDGLKNKRWCDRYETKGKRSGAFSSSSYGNPPYILMNYKPDVFAEIYTLAHEAGHSMHSWYSQRHQNFQDYHYPIFLAEVASTFNEELLTHHLLEHTKDRDMRAYIINRQIDDIRGTVIRQTMFAEFEKITHAMEEAGEALTLDAFKQVYRKLLDDYFGSDFVIDEDLELECLRIPHFYSAFYVYKYATGLSAAVALSDRVLNGGKTELDDYLGFLKSGRSRFPLETLKSAGVDMSKPDPIGATLDLFDKRVSELEELLGV
jgi:oligoendopeptidase F